MIDRTANLTDSQPFEWLPLTEPYTALNGLTVVPVSNQTELMSLGIHFNNALKNLHREFSYECTLGVMQIVKILGCDDRVLHCASIRCHKNEAFAEAFRAYANINESTNVSDALEEWLESVNAGEIPSSLHLGKSSFVTVEHIPSALPRI
ncbi:hypothetical protein TH5_21335 [Thalassospira xianhensis MCCC 1A02616]|uniref:Uncharacterized protein n=1 Tax=Thalassospira xianhensis MCCC 1A02616 TaxID=1177929 RepID=A0A367U890_9PROT|nr:hypothetical protein TH5_21335 [Thalassospira xianhensis MCCC 1A02616]